MENTCKTYFFKILSLKKYFFLNLAAAISVLFWMAIYICFVTDYPPEFVDFASIFLWAIVVLFFYGLALIEILIREFVINKYFHFKLNFPIKLPKFLDILYYILFFTGLLLSIGPALFAVIFILEANFIF